MTGYSHNSQMSGLLSFILLLWRSIHADLLDGELWPREGRHDLQTLTIRANSIFCRVCSMLLLYNISLSLSLISCSSNPYFSSIQIKCYEKTLFFCNLFFCIFCLLGCICADALATDKDSSSLHVWCNEDPEFFGARFCVCFLHQRGSGFLTFPDQTPSATDDKQLFQIGFFEVFFVQKVEILSGQVGYADQL